MNERLLQYIWQFGHFNKANLITLLNEPVQIISAGTLNYNQGPDFLDGKIRIGNTLWAGNVELHINTSQWDQHKHSTDINYENVILHVVWKHDSAIQAHAPSLIPTIELANRVPKVLLERYDQLMNSASFIACEKSISQVSELVWINWKERILIERLQKKSAVLLNYLSQNNNHWEESFWWAIAKNFGAKVNTDAFEKIAQSIPLNVFAKTKSQVQQVEAVLFGQANLLRNKFNESYPGMLKKEYEFIRNKFGLRPALARLHFLRMRPSNFPTIRLAQLAMLLHQSESLFSKVLETDNLKILKELLSVSANDYWHYHYVFDEPSDFKIKNLGDDMINNLLINTIIPTIFAYGKFHNNQALKDKALEWMAAISSENNAIIKSFSTLGISATSAFDSQALIQLKNEYCNQFKCLDCAVGNWLLKRN